MIKLSVEDFCSDANLLTMRENIGGTAVMDQIVAMARNWHGRDDGRDMIPAGTQYW